MQALAYTYYYMVFLGGVFECQYVAPLDGMPPQPSVAEERAVAATNAQTVAPTVHKHAVAGNECRAETVAADGVDGEADGTENKHRQSDKQ